MRLSSRFLSQLSGPLHRQLLLLPLLLLCYLLKFPSPLLLFHDHEVLEQAVTQMLAHLLIRRLRELVIVILVIEMPMKACFERKAIHYAELAPENDPGSLEFGLLEAKAARVVAELGGFLGDKLGDDAHLEVFVGMERFLRSVYENVFLP